MGAGLAQIGVLMVLTVVGLPLFFFGLMAALDRFERSLSDAPRVPAPTTAAPAESGVTDAAIERDADVLTLPVAPAASALSMTQGSAASKPAAAI